MRRLVAAFLSVLLLGAVLSVPLGSAIQVTATVVQIHRVSVSSAGIQGNAPSGGDLPTPVSAAPFASTPDGRLVVYSSQASNLVPGDSNEVEDVFIRDTQTGLTERVSVPADGEANGPSILPRISADGRFVSFVSEATNLADEADTNAAADLFIADRTTGSIVRYGWVTDSAESIANGSFSADGRHVSLEPPAEALDSNEVVDVFVLDRDWPPNGTFDEPGEYRGFQVSVGIDGPANGDSAGSVLSADGRFVAFSSGADNLVEGDANGTSDVFVHDRDSDGNGIFDEIPPGDPSGTTTFRLSLSTGGAEGNGASYQPTISSDGRFVVFTTDATNLVSGDENGATDVVVRDRDADGDGIFDEPGAVTTTLVSLDDNDAQFLQASSRPSMSADSRFVSFMTTVGDGAPSTIWVRDRAVGSSRMVTTSLTGAAAPDGPSDASTLSADGRTLVLRSAASDLVPGDTNEAVDVFAIGISPDPIERVSIAPDGDEVSGDSRQPDLSADGRFVAFASTASDLVDDDGNEAQDVFVRDRATGIVERVSVGIDGEEGDADSGAPSMSPDGRFVAFESAAGTLAPDDGNELTDVFLHDRVLRTTELVSIGLAGGSAAGASFDASVSRDGNFIVFTSTAPDLVENDTFDGADVFLYDRGAGTIEIVGLGTEGVQGSGSSGSGSVSVDGRYVAFVSAANELVGLDVHEGTDVFVYDRDAQLTELVDLNDEGEQGLGDSFDAVMTPDGRHVAFASFAANLVDDDGNGEVADVFVRDRELGTTERASVGMDGQDGDAPSGSPAISDDGEVVAFHSLASNLVSEEDGNGASDVFVRHRGAGAVITELASVSTDGTSGNADSESPALEADGTVVAFTSSATDLVADDGNDVPDIFVRDRSVEIGPPEPEPSSTPFPSESPPPPGPEVSAAVELTVDVDGADGQEVGAGAAEVDIADIPPEAIPLTLGSIESAPLRSIELAESPLRSIPLRSIPLRSIGLLNDPIGSVLLSSIPITTPGGWAAVLEGTSLQGVPLHTVTLREVLDLDPPSIASLTLEQIDLSASPLRSIGLASISLGATPLRSIPLPPAPGSTEAQAWCEFLAQIGFDCDALGVTNDSTLLALDIAGVPLRSIPLHGIPLRSIDLDASPLRSIPLAELSIEVSPLRSIPLRSIALDSAPLRSIPLRSIPLRSIDLDASPLRSIPLRSIASCVTIVDVTKVDCSSMGTDTLGHAADEGAIPESATLGDIIEALDGFTFGDLGDYGDLTVGDVYDAFPEDITLAGVLIALLDTLDYAWEELPLDEIGVQDFARVGGELDYRLDFELNADVSIPASVLIRFDLPAGFRPVPQDEWFITGGDGEGTVLGIDIGQPTVTASGVEFAAAELPIGTPLTLTLPVRPGLQLGSFDAAVTVTPLGGSSSDPVAAAVTVVESFEPNDDPASAPSLDEGVLYISHITSADDLDFFRIPAPPAGSRITVHLSHLSDDNDLVVYSPAGSNLRAASPRSIGVQGSAVEDDGIDFDTLDDALAPETLQDVPLVLPNVTSISATRLAGDETVEAVSTGGGDFYTIQVSGYNGATSDQPYVLRVEIDDPITLPACAPRVLPGSGGTAGAIPALPADLNTIFLVNQERLGDTFGAAAQAQVMAALGTLASRGDLDVAGAVVPIEGSPAVATAFDIWDANPCDPVAANGVVNAIGTLIDAIQADRPTLEHVVLVGGDDLVPMARVPDMTTLANERDYAATFADGNHQYLGALATEHILSDDPYVDFDPIPFLDRHLFLPDLAIGRLVETPAEIVAAIDTFIDFEGTLDPQTALTTGYDFLADGAADVSGALSTATGATAHLLVTEDWDRAELLANFLPSGGVAPDIASVNAHYDHNRSLPALGNSTADESDLFTTGDVDAAGLSLLGRILFTMGCHAGLSVSDVIVGAAVPNAPDWAQTFAAHDAAAYVANTGYGYGDTAAVAYSERLMTLFAERLNGTMTIGEALIFAKQEYFAGLALVGVYDEKAMTEAAFYGLPMYRVGAAAAPPAPPAPPATTTDPITGLEAAELELEPAFTLQNGPIGDYYEANLPGSASHVQVTHYRPVQPRIEIDVTQPDAIAHDALITGLTQAPDEVLDPAYSRPIVDLAANEPETAFGDAIFPSRLQGLVTYNAPDGQRQRLVVVPGQFFTDPGVADGLGVQRRFTEVDALVMYTDEQSTDFVRPVIRQVGATTIGTTVSFDVEATDADGATAFGIAEAPSIARVLVLFRHEADPLAWTPVDLVNAPGTNRWTGGATVLDSNGDPVASADIAYFVQAVDASGNVGVSTNKGSYFATVAAPPTTPDGVDVDGPTSDGTWYRDSVTVSVEGAGQFSRSIDGGAPVGFDGSFTVTDDGVHDVEILRDGASFASLVIPIDTTPPTVVIDSPPDGASYTLGDPVTAAFRCIDALSGVTSCEGSTADGAALDTSTVGSHPLTVSARDVAGNESEQVTRAYAVTYPFSGFFSPVKNQPTMNVVRAGRGVPLKFSLSGDRGLDIFVAGSPSSARVSCASDGPNDDVEVTVTAGSSSLSYDAQADQYVYVWKTERTWKDTCRRITFTLDDGTTHSTVFRFD